MIIQNLKKSYMHDGEELVVLDNFSVSIPPRSIVALVGPSGCGKTTLLRLIGNLEKRDGGTILCEENEDGPISYLFQEPRLLPWFSAKTNVELALRPFIANSEERKKRAMDFLDMVGLGPFARFKPDELSGGMRQRVAIARSFAYPGRVMLLDEPFQNLDNKLRWSLIRSFLSLWEQEKRTTIYVTHDICEALFLSDVTMCLSDRPMRILDSVNIPIPHEKRSLSDPQLIRIQERLLFELTKTE